MSPAPDTPDTPPPLVLVLRPEPGAQATLDAARALGLEARAFPLFEIRPLAWQAPPPGTIDALILGSANAVRHAGPALAAFRGKPTYAVGAKTAEAARAAGLVVVRTGHGGLQNVLDAIDPAHRRLLRLSGRERVELALPEQVTMTTCTLYASEPRPGDEALRDILAKAAQRPVVALLHSGEAATRLEALCRSWGLGDLATHAIHLAAIGPRVSARLEASWAAVRDAERPEDGALLALAAQMCQEVASGSIQADNQT